MKSGETVIQVRDLTMGYGDTALLRNADFEVKKGEVFIILGGSGCGKSTLLKHMIGLAQPISGSILINGTDIVTALGDQRLAILRGIGVMYQNGALFGSMNLLENVCLPLEEFTDLDEDAREFIATTKLKLVGLDQALYKMPSEISGGMRKRAAIARAMALDPGILFLDEPSAGLDPITSAQLDQLILELAANLGLTFVVVTHELPSIYTIASRAIMLDKVKRAIVARGIPAELRDNSPDPWVRQFFNRQPQASTT